MFEEVRRTRPEIDGAEENIVAGRMQLMAEIRAEKRPARSVAVRRRWTIAGGLIGGAAAVAAGVLVVAGLHAPVSSVEAVPSRTPGATLTPTPAPVPTRDPLTSASAFGAAASAATTFTGLAVGEGQYLQMHVDSEQAIYHRPDAEEGMYQTDRSNATDAWVHLISWDYFVPVDPQQSWYTRSGQVSVGETFGPNAAALAEKYIAEAGTGSPLQPLAGGKRPPWGGPGGFTMSAFLDAMPRDPAQLIEWVRHNQEAGGGTVPGDDYKVGWLLVDMLSDYVLPGEARAAMYNALSMLGGSEIIAEEGDVVTLRFSAPQQALSGADGVMRRSVTIDMSTGLVLSKSVSLDTASPLVPATVMDERYTYTYSVVDGLP